VTSYIYLDGKAYMVTRPRYQAGRFKAQTVRRTVSGKTRSQTFYTELRWGFDLLVPYKAHVTQLCTISIATPGVVTCSEHGLVSTNTFDFHTTGALPTGITAGRVYYVKKLTNDTFEFAATSGGASINTTGTQSGTHYIRSPGCAIFDGDIPMGSLDNLKTAYEKESVTFTDMFGTDYVVYMLGELVEQPIGPLLNDTNSRFIVPVMLQESVS